MNWLQHQFELSRGGSGDNVRPMEGIRGFAVFLVFLVHYVTLIDPWLAKQSAIHLFAGMLHGIGNTGVDLFFVLSGYLIYGSLISRPQTFLRFMSRRVERIYPAFLSVFVIYVALSFIFPQESKLPQASLEAAIYLVQNLLLLPGLFQIDPMITVAWSLSYEMFYYLTIPIVITLFDLRRRSAGWRVLLFLLLAAATVIYCAAYGGPVRLIMFVSGILLYEAIKGGLVRSLGSSVAITALVIGLLATLLPVVGSSGGALKISILFATFFAFCHSCFVRPTEWLARAFSWTPLRWLGNMSYSYYLLHGLALKAAFLVLAVYHAPTQHGFIFFWMLMPIMFALTAVPSAVLFLSIERPFSLAPRGDREKWRGPLESQTNGATANPDAQRSVGSSCKG